MTINPITGQPIIATPGAPDPNAPAPITVVPPAGTPVTTPGAPVTTPPGSTPAPVVVPPAPAATSLPIIADAPPEAAVPARSVRQVTLNQVPLVTPMGAPLYIEDGPLTYTPGDVAIADATGELNPAAGITVAGTAVTGLPAGILIDGQGVLVSAAKVASAPIPVSLASLDVRVTAIERRLNGGAAS